MKLGNLALLLACVTMTGLPACGSDDNGGGKSGTGGTGTGGSGATGGSSGGTGGSGASGGSGGSTGGSGGSATGGVAGTSTGGAAGGGGTAGASCVLGTGAEIVTCVGGTEATTITIQDFMFSPSTVTVSVDDIVMFDNTSQATTHSATSGSPTCLDGNFDTGGITADSSKCVKFNQAGSYPFFCMFHNTMTGTITVN